MKNEYYKTIKTAQFNTTFILIGIYRHHANDAINLNVYNIFIQRPHLRVESSKTWRSNYSHYINRRPITKLCEASCRIPWKNFKGEIAEHVLT